jgi:hypothetical protein
MAYLLWSALNVALLLFAAGVLQTNLFPAWDGRVIGFLFVSFFPALVNLLQEQDSILLLCLFVGAFAASRSRSEFAIGCLLAGGLFKFQFAFPCS